MASRVEVSFNPHGGAEEWPQFLACVGDPAGVETLYELGRDGWRGTFQAGGPGGFAVGDSPLTDARLEDRLWEGAAALTENPDAEAMSQQDGSDTWVPFASSKEVGGDGE